MAQSKRSSNTQQTKGRAAQTPNASPSPAKKQAGGSSARARAAASPAPRTSGGRTGAARQSGTAARSRSSAPASPEPVYREPVLDDGARHDIAGVVIAVIGVALLIAVLTPTSGVLTQAVSSCLHAVLGLGAFLLPVGLLLWALTFFVHLPQLVPGRVAIGLGIIAIAVMGLVGLCTPGCEADPARLFNEYILADRGGYIGNGLAWLLLTLVGKTVGIVALSGLIVAGLIVVGLNAGHAVQSLTARYQQHRAYARMRSEERANARAQSAARQARAAMPADVPGSYAPTSLFDPARPLSQQQCAPQAAPYSMPTQVFYPQVPAPTASAPLPSQPSASSPTQMFVGTPGATTVLPGAYAAAQQHYFGCGNVPGGAGAPVGFPAERAASQQPASMPMAARPVSGAATPSQEASLPDTGVPAADAPAPTTFVQPQPMPGEDAFHYSAGASEVVDKAAQSPSDAPSNPARRGESRRARNASRWWDPADDWNRDDFDPRDMTPTNNELVPGVLPGAPVFFDDGCSLEPPASSQREVTAATATASTRVAPPVAADVENGASAAVAVARDDAYRIERDEDQDDDRDDSASSRVTRRTKAALEAAARAPQPPARPAASATPAPSRARAQADRACDASSVELPWEPARVNAEGIQPSAVSHGSVGTYELPDPSIMQRSDQGIRRTPEQEQEAAMMAGLLQTTLAEFGVKAEVVDWVEGPTCTTYEVNPGEGVRVSRFTSLEDDIARALARDGVRIYAPVPNTSYVGIEVPNTTRQTVYFGDVLPYVDGGPLDFAVGLDANGKPVHVDLAKLPHILVAGTTGSGKSVMVNTIVMSMLMRDTPDEVRLIMIDPKQVEFNDYNGIPHLIMPVVTDMRQAAAALQWGVTEMDRRYRVFSNVGVRDLKGYNRMVEEASSVNGDFPLCNLPSIVIVIDELADLMMVAKKDVEASIVRIAQLGRACGIHLVMATQSPRADVVTGLIRANVANRIGLKVAKGTDSKIVIDQVGAEKLLGNGDMLFLQTNWGDRPRRIQGCWISDNEISQVVEHLKNQGGPEYNCQMAPLPGAPVAQGAAEDASATSGHAGDANDDDPLAWEAAKLVVENQMGSTSMIQRRLKLGYARAGRVMDMLEEMGVVGPARGSKPRDVLIRDLDELATLRGEFDATEGEY